MTQRVDDVSKIVGHTYPDQHVAWNRRDVIIYALGLGASDPAFTFEDHEDFEPLPTYPLVLSFKGLSQDIVPFGVGMSFPPGLHIDPSMILHGEQSIEIFQDLPAAGEGVLKGKVLGMYDKGKGALMTTETTLVCKSSGAALCKMTAGVFFRGLTDFGGAKGGGLPPVDIPDRAADDVVDVKTVAEQALLYRLSGDYNPLHADESMAQAVGFDKPILHGLCTFGMTCKAAMKRYGGDCSSSIKKFSARFAAPMYPGETLRVEMWRSRGSSNEVIVRASALERKKVVLSNAVILLNEQGARSKL